MTVVIGTSRLPLRETEVVVIELVVRDRKVLRDKVAFPEVITVPFAGKAEVVGVAEVVEDWARTCVATEKNVKTPRRMRKGEMCNDMAAKGGGKGMEGPEREDGVYIPGIQAKDVQNILWSLVRTHDSSLFCGVAQPPPLPRAGPSLPILIRQLFLPLIVFCSNSDHPPCTYDVFYDRYLDRTKHSTN